MLPRKITPPRLLDGIVALLDPMQPAEEVLAEAARLASGPLSKRLRIQAIDRKPSTLAKLAKNPRLASFYSRADLQEILTTAEGRALQDLCVVNVGLDFAAVCNFCFGKGSSGRIAHQMRLFWLHNPQASSAIVEVLSHQQLTHPFWTVYAGDLLRQVQLAHAQRTLGSDVLRALIFRRMTEQLFTQEIRERIRHSLRLGYLDAGGRKRKITDDDLFAPNLVLPFFKPGSFLSAQPWGFWLQQVHGELIAMNIAPAKAPVSASGLVMVVDPAKDSDTGPSESMTLAMDLAEALTRVLVRQPLAPGEFFARTLAFARQLAQDVGTPPPDDMLKNVL